MKKTPIKVYIKDKLDSKGSNWELGIWSYVPEQLVWGLVYEGRETQMCYRWPEDNPKKAILRRRDNFKNDPNEDWLRWFFDVGRRLYVTDDDLEAACKLLDIWDIPENV